MKNDTIEIRHADSDVVEVREMTDEEQATVDRARAQIAERRRWRCENESLFDTQKAFVEAYKKHFGVSSMS